MAVAVAAKGVAAALGSGLLQKSHVVAGRIGEENRVEKNGSVGFRARGSFGRVRTQFIGESWKKGFVEIHSKELPRKLSASNQNMFVTEDSPFKKQGEPVFDTTISSARNIEDEEWQLARRKESVEIELGRQLERQAEEEKEGKYRDVAQQLKAYPEEEVNKARRFVSSLIRAGEKVEEVIEKAAEEGELSPLILLVIRNRLELARHDDERDAIQALDLLFRRVELELLQRDASLAMQLLHELLNLHDGFSHEEWLRRSRTAMIQVFPPEDAFTILGSPGMDLENQMGPIEIPEEDDALLRIDFIREVDELLLELESEAKVKPVSGLDAQSVAVRLRQQEKLNTIQQVRDLRRLAATLKW